MSLTVFESAKSFDGKAVIYRTLVGSKVSITNIFTSLAGQLLQKLVFKYSKHKKKKEIYCVKAYIVSVFNFT